MKKITLPISSRPKPHQSIKLRRALLTSSVMVMAMGWMPQLSAAPTGGQVTMGQATIANDGTPGHQTTRVTQTSPRAVIEWEGFEVAPGDAVNFVQPDRFAATLNHIAGAQSSIQGRVQANGSLYFVNQNGFVFAANSNVTAQNLVVLTQNIDAHQFMHAENPVKITDAAAAAVAGAAIHLNGTIAVADHGVAEFFAPHIAAGATAQITANQGSVTMIGTAGDHAAGRGRSAIILAQGSKITANAQAGDAGTITIMADDLILAGDIEAASGQGVAGQGGAGQGTYQGGQINLTSTGLLVINRAQFDSSAASGHHGAVNISAPHLEISGRVIDQGTDQATDQATGYWSGQAWLGKPWLGKPWSGQANVITANALQSWLAHNPVRLHATAPAAKQLGAIHLLGPIELNSENSLTLVAGLGGITLMEGMSNRGRGQLVLAVDGTIGDADIVPANYQALFANITLAGKLSFHEINASVTNNYGGIHINQNVTLTDHGTLTARVNGKGDIAFAPGMTIWGGGTVALTTTGGNIRLGGDLAVSDPDHNAALRLSGRKILASSRLAVNGGIFTFEQTDTAKSPVTFAANYAGPEDASVLRVNLANAQVALKNQGDIILGEGQDAVGSLSVITAGNIEVNSAILSHGTLSLKAGQNLLVKARLQAAGDLSLDAQNLIFAPPTGTTATGWLQAGPNAYLRLRQGSNQSDLVLDAEFLAWIHDIGEINLEIFSGRDVTLMAPLTGNGHNLVALTAQRDVIVAAAVTVGGLKLDGEVIYVNNQVTVAAGGLTALSIADPRRHLAFGILFGYGGSTASSDPTLTATQGGAITLETKNGGAIEVDFNLDAANLTVKNGGNFVKFSQAVSLVNSDGKSGLLTVNSGGSPGDVSFLGKVTATAILITTNTGAVTFNQPVTLNMIDTGILPKPVAAVPGTPPQLPPSPYLGGVLNIVSKKGVVTFASAATLRGKTMRLVYQSGPGGVPIPSLSLDSSTDLNQIIIVTTGILHLESDIGVHPNGILSLTAWKLNFTKLKADEASIKLSQLGAQRNYMGSRLIKVIPYNLVIDDKISIKHVKNALFQTLDTVFLKQDLNVPNLAFVATRVVYDPGRTITVPPGGTLAIAQYQSYTVDAAFFRNIKGYQDANLKLISGHDLTLNLPLTMTGGNNLGLLAGTITLNQTVTMNGGKLAINYINTNLRDAVTGIAPGTPTGKFSQNLADKITLTPGSTLAVASEGNLEIDAKIDHLTKADFIADAGYLRVSQPILASQTLNFTSKTGVIEINQIVGVPVIGAIGVTFVTPDNARNLKFGAKGGILATDIFGN